MTEATQQVEGKELKHIDSLVFKSFVERFNKEFQNNLIAMNKTLYKNWFDR